MVACDHYLFHQPKEPFGSQRSPKFGNDDAVHCYYSKFLNFLYARSTFIIVRCFGRALYFYLWKTSKQEPEEPELFGASLAIGSLPVRKRRLTVVVMFLLSASVILIASEPFVESLIKTGETLGIDEFILIQWIAPLASESPKIIIAILFSLRANPVAGMTTLISSEVNQLTVLIGSMVVIFSIAVGQPLSFHLESRQAVEFFLTSAVSVFAILLISSRVLSWRNGLCLLGLFVAHLFFVEETERLIFTFIYLGLSGFLVITDSSSVKNIFKPQPKQSEKGMEQVG